MSDDLLATLIVALAVVAWLVLVILHERAFSAEETTFTPATCRSEIPAGIGIKGSCDRPAHQLDVDPWHEVHNAELDARWKVDDRQTTAQYIYQHTPKENP